MKGKILGLLTGALLAGLTGSPASAVVDQSNPVTNAGFNGSLNWQQEVVVGVTGLLSGLEITFDTRDPASGTLGIWAGSPWQAGAPLYSTGYSGAAGATFFDLSAAGIFLSAGDIFTFGLDGTAGAIQGSYLESPPSGVYAGDLYIEFVQNACFDDCGWDLAFRTFMTPVPEPGTLALLGLGLAGLGLSRRRKAN